jgi:hypothetical protein
MQSCQQQMEEDGENIPMHHRHSRIRALWTGAKTIVETPPRRTANPSTALKNARESTAAANGESVHRLTAVEERSGKHRRGERGVRPPPLTAVGERSGTLSTAAANGESVHRHSPPIGNPPIHRRERARSRRSRRSGQRARFKHLRIYLFEIHSK